MKIPPHILGVILIFALVAILPLILNGPTGGHSILFNLAWLTSFDDQLHDGELYPR